MPVVVVFVQGLFEIVGIGSFLSGFFAHIYWLMVLGGCLVVIDDITQVAMGILNPLFPSLLALILAVIISPLYVGVFWASASFKILGIPTSLRKLFTPKRIATHALSKAGRF